MIGGILIESSILSLERFIERERRDRFLQTGSEAVTSGQRGVGWSVAWSLLYKC